MMLGKKRMIIVLVALVAAIMVGGAAVIYFFYGSASGHERLYAYKNGDADTKMNALTNKLVEFSLTDYEKVQVNDTQYMWMSPVNDDWDGTHFIFDLSGYDVGRLTSLRFTWVGRIIGPEDCDCAELWCYKDSGWVKFDDVNQSVWMTRTGEWTSSLGDYVDTEGKVHFSVVVHVKSGGPMETIRPYLLTQFVDFELSYSD
jgi:hypothetical protein